MPKSKKAFVHETAIVEEGVQLGEGSNVWHFAHVREKASIGKNCNIGKSSYIDFEVNIGDNVKIQNFVSVYHGVTIEDDVFVGPSVTFTNDMRPRARLWDDSRLAKTLIKRGASVGANSTVLGDLTLGEHCMVGAGSVVTEDVPARALVYGNPARVKGFVCDCGLKLDAEGLCTECNKKYDIDN